MQELNVVIGQPILLLNQDLIYQFFGKESYRLMPEDCDMYDLLVLLGAFPSKSEARKNWNRTGKEIPPGYNEFKDIGKQKKALYIWNPVGDEE
jgi:hypothetical protein